MAKTTSDTKAASYDIIATTLREKIHVPKGQFKAYFLSLLADKEYTRIFDNIAKVEKSFRRPTPYFRTQARGNLRSSPYPRVMCYRYGTPGHKSTQCNYLLLRLQRVQLAAASFVIKRYAKTSDIIDLGWLPFNENRDLNLCKTTFKAMYDVNWPAYLRVTVRHPNRTLRPSAAVNLEVPKHSGTL